MPVAKIDTASPAPTGLRAAHKSLTRELIRNAARELFTAGSVNAVTMEQIAAAAGVSRPTVYGHFKDKDEIIGDIAAAYARRAIEVNKAIAGPDPSIAQIRAWLEGKVTFYRDEGVTLSLLHQAGHGDPGGRLKVAHRMMTEAIEALAQRLPALQMALEPGDHQPHARVRAEMLVRQITAACDLCAREGMSPANEAALDVTASMLRELLDRFAAMQPPGPDQ